MSNWVLIVVFVLMTFLGALGSVGLKKGAGSAKSVIGLVFNGWFVAGGFLYVISALMDIWLLKYMPYVVVLPLTALTYCWSMALARFFFKEQVTAMKLAGLLLILIGTVLLVV